MKRLDRLKQWAGEKMGGEVKTTVSDDFKSMEAEMELRHTGAYTSVFIIFRCIANVFYSRHGKTSRHNE